MDEAVKCSGAKRFCLMKIVVLVTQAPGFRVVPRAQKTPQPIVPKESSLSRKSHKASSSAGECRPDLQRATLSPDGLSFNTRAFSLLAGHSKAGADRGSACGLDQASSPAPLISSSCAPLIKNEQKQVGALLHMPVSELTGFKKSTFSVRFADISAAAAAV